MCSIKETSLNCHMAFTQKCGYIWKARVWCFNCAVLEQEGKEKVKTVSISIYKFYFNTCILSVQIQWPMTDLQVWPHRKLSSFCIRDKVERTSTDDRKLPHFLSKNNQDPPYFWSEMYALSWQLTLWASIFTPDVQHKYRSNKKETHDQNWNRPTKNKEKK